MLIKFFQAVWHHRCRLLNAEGCWSECRFPASTCFICRRNGQCWASVRFLVLEKRECKKLASNQILNLVCRIWVYRGLHLSNPVSNSTYWIQILLSNQIRFSVEHLEGSINNSNFIICYRVLSVERAGTCVVLSHNEMFTSRQYQQEIRR